MYEKEDITITRMLNLETGRQLADLEKNSEDVTTKRLLVKGQLAQINKDNYALEQSSNVFKNTLNRLSDANETEKCCIVAILDQVKQMRVLLAEEKVQHEQYRGMTMLQRKQINGLEQK